MSRVQKKNPGQWTHRECTESRRRVLDTGGVSRVQKKSPGYRRSVQRPEEESWIQEECPESRRRVPDTRGVSRGQKKSPGFNRTLWSGQFCGLSQLSSLQSTTEPGSGEPQEPTYIPSTLLSSHFPVPFLLLLFLSSQLYVFASFILHLVCYSLLYLFVYLFTFHPIEYLYLFPFCSFLPFSRTPMLVFCSFSSLK